jgi:hypothetical protein
MKKMDRYPYIGFWGRTENRETTFIRVLFIRYNTAIVINTNYDYYRRLIGTVIGLDEIDFTDEKGDEHVSLHR